MAEGTGLDAPIAAVTVFTDGARVQRSGTVSVEPGLADRSDPRPAGQRGSGVGPGRGPRPASGPANVEVHPRYRADPLREETARLRSEVDRCRDAVQAVDDEDTAEQARLDFLGYLSGAAATALARAVSRPRRPR